MWASKGELNAWKERALRAEAQVDSLLAQKTSVISLKSPISGAEEGSKHEDEAPFIPPPVEEAIARRSRPGSDLDRTLRRQTEEAMTKGGSDFDADAFARHIELGSRVEGWPL